MSIKCISFVLLLSVSVFGSFAFANADCENPIRENLIARDGVALAIKHFSNVGKTPIIMQHGVAANDRHFDLNYKDFSMARWFCKAGFDVYVTNLRGVGTKGFESEIPLKKWSIDDFILNDFPTIFDFVISKTHDRPFVFAHSMGGWIASAFFQGVKLENGNLVSDLELSKIRNSQARGLVLLSPALTVHWEKSIKELMHLSMYDINSNLFWRVNPLLELVAADKNILNFLYKTKILNADFISRILWSPQEAGVLQYSSKFNLFYEYLAHKLLVGSNLLSLLFYPKNADPEAVHVGARDMIADVSGNVFYQFCLAINSKSSLSFDGKFNYIQNINKVELPVLTFTGGKDLLINRVTVFEDAIMKIGSKDKTLIDLKNYGHVDYFVGKNIHEEVFKPILKWVNNH